MPSVSPLATTVNLGSTRLGDGGLVGIFGPCVLESEEGATRIGEGVAEVCGRLGLPWVFKASFDKANRTSKASFRGPGLDEGLGMLQRIGGRLGVPVTTDVHLPEQAPAVAQVAALLQVPALLCRQTDLLEACAATGRPVNVKKGQFLAPDDMGAVLGKLRPGGAVLTERGTTFGYHDLVVDFRGLPAMRALGVPICFDTTHAVQRPGGGATSGGDRRQVPFLAHAAAAVGIDALFAEVHDRPEEALSDGPNMVRLDELEGILRGVLKIRAALAGG